MRDIIIIGSGGHAASAIDVIESTNLFNIKGHIEKNQKNFNQKGDYPIIGEDKDLKNIRSHIKNAFIGIGQIKSSNLRKKLFKLLLELGFKLPKIISPYSYVSSKTSIGKGTILFHNVFVNSGVAIGNNCIINSKSLIEHDVEIMDNCHIAPGAILNGNVIIESGSFIGSGSIVKESIKIKKNSIIGAGVTVFKDTLPNSKIVK